MNTGMPEPGTGAWPGLPEPMKAAWSAVSAPLLVHDRQSVLFANAPLLRLLGYDAVSLSCMAFYAWATPECRLKLRDYGLQALAQQGLAPTVEIEALTASGAMRILELSARPVTHAGALFNVLTVVDLSDIRHVQTSMLDIGRVLHQIIENSPVPTFVMDAQHHVTHWNAACAQLTGYDSIDMLGRDDAWKAFYSEKRQLLADLIIDGTIESLRDALYGGLCRRSELLDNAYEVESFYPRMSEGGRWLHFTAAPLMDVNGAVVGAIETLQDVTRRRRAEEELRRHRDQLEEAVAERTAELMMTHHELEAFLENASVGIVTTINHRIVRGNRKFLEIFELGEESAAGQLTRRFFPSDEAFESLSAVASPVLMRGESLQHEMEMVSGHGRRLWVEMIAYVANPHDRLAKTWWLMQDRTEERQVQLQLQDNYRRIKQTNTRLEEAQNQLLQSEKMASIGQLAAGVAHEINNPIGFVNSNLGTLRGYVEPMFQLIDVMQALPSGELPAPVAEALALLDRQIDLEFVKGDLPQLLNESEDGLIRVKKIVQDLKDFSRVDHSEWQEADLNAGLDSTLNVVMNEVKYKATVRKDYGVLPPVRCIAAQLNQVFMNLIVNAAHAIPDRGEIVLRTRAEEDVVCVEVQDSGVGMSEDVKRRIFEPFFTTKPVGQGTGLGLSLSFSIIQKHAGRIEVDSAEGQGTTFRICLPVNPPSVAKG